MQQDLAVNQVPVIFADAGDVVTLSNFLYCCNI